MEPNETQPQNPTDDIPLTSDELAAAMGYMTTIGDDVAMAEQEDMMGEEAPMEPQEAPQQETEDIDAKIQEAVQTAVKEQITPIKEQIEELLKEDDKEK